MTKTDELFILTDEDKADDFSKRRALGHHTTVVAESYFIIVLIIDSSVGLILKKS
jgi:hypothetical protein